MCVCVSPDSQNTYSIRSRIVGAELPHRLTILVQAERPEELPDGRPRLLVLRHTVASIVVSLPALAASVRGSSSSGIASIVVSLPALATSVRGSSSSGIASIVVSLPVLAASAALRFYVILILFDQVHQSASPIYEDFLSPRWPDRTSLVAGYNISNI